MNVTAASISACLWAAGFGAPAVAECRRGASSASTVCNQPTSAPATIMMRTSARPGVLATV
jgi:hypothetical protein